MKAHLMLIHRELVKDYSEDDKKVLNIDKYWDWDWKEQTEEFSSQLVFMNNRSKFDPLPCADATYRLYGKECLIGQSILSPEQMNMVSALVELLKRGQKMRIDLPSEGEKQIKLN